MSPKRATVNHNDNSRIGLDWTLLTKGCLYGRQQECNDLRQAFNRRSSANSQSEFILVSGRSGTGKTALVRTLREPVAAKRGLLLMGKFDQMQRHEPYAPLVAAFTEFVQYVLAKDQNTIKNVRDAVLEAVGAHGHLLTDLIPRLKLVLGQLEPSNLKTVEVQNKLRSTFRNFVRAICSRERPLVLAIDDLQWADSGSLDLLEILVSDEKNPGLTVVGVCRSDEVCYHDHFAVMLRNLEDKHRTRITNIMVKNMSPDAVNFLVSDLLRYPEERCKELSKAIFEKTRGNVFYVIQLMEALYSKGALTVNRSLDELSWDEGILFMVTENDNVTELLSGKLKNLPDNTQIVLSTAACLGTELDKKLLTTILPDYNLTEALGVAEVEGLIMKDERKPGKFFFAHDRVQQAAYSLIDANEQALVHLSIGRLMRNNLSEEEIVEQIFAIVDQMSRGVEIIRDQVEEAEFADLCLQAGGKAIRSSDFKTAVLYLWLGVRILKNQQHWKHQYFLSLQLYNTIAEAEYCVANFEKMDEAVQEVLTHARCFRDKVRAYSTQVYSLGGRLMFQEAIDLGLEVLECLGETFPAKLSKLHLLKDIAKTSFWLHRTKDSELLILPNMKNPEKIAAMGMLNILTTYAYIGNPELLPFLASRMVRLSLKHGLCAISAAGFSMYGVVHCAIRNFTMGYRCGQLALSIIDRYGTAGFEWIPRVYTWYYGFIVIWKSPIRSTLDKLLSAHKIAMETGDIEFSMLASYVCCYNGFIAGISLPYLEGRLKLYLDLMDSYRQSTIGNMASLLMQTIHNFMGKSDDPVVLTGENMEQERDLAQLIEKENVASLFNLMTGRLMLAYYFGNLELALEMAESSRALNRGRSSFVSCLQCFYDGMVALALARKSKRKAHLSIARRSLRMLRKLSRFCPQNCMNKVLLIEAEVAAIKGHHNLAMEKFEKSIAIAETEGFLHENALANERAGEALCHFHYCDAAALYFKKAALVYQEWGAAAKVSQLTKNHPEVSQLTRDHPSSSNGAMSTKSRTSATSTATSRKSNHAWNIHC